MLVIPGSRNRVIKGMKEEAFHSSLYTKKDIMIHAKMKSIVEIKNR